MMDFPRRSALGSLSGEPSGKGLTLGRPWPRQLRGAWLQVGGFALIGLFPTFFGLALILIYVLTREAKQPEPKSEAAAPADLPKAE